MSVPVATLTLDEYATLLDSWSPGEKGECYICGRTDLLFRRPKVIDEYQRGHCRECRDSVSENVTNVRRDLS